MDHLKISLLVSFFFVQVLVGVDSKLWTCENHQKIEEVYKCDGMVDCWDQSDETRVLCNTTCDEGEFICHGTNQCIPEDSTCDRFEDCRDGSDEWEELCHVTTTEPPLYGLCPTSTFECLDGLRCLNKRFECDGSPDCDDGSDESNCDQDQDIDIEPTESSLPTTKVPPKIPKKCLKKPFISKCKAFWPVLAMNLKEKLVRKCIKKPKSKRCLKYAGLLAFREPPAPKKKRNKKLAKLAKKCAKNPGRKGCDGILGIN